MVQILLVEDDLEICEILQFYLPKNPEYSVTVAHSAGPHNIQRAVLTGSLAARVL